MLSRVHNKLGTAGLIVAVVALVAALGGAAFAAAGLNATQKKEVKKIAKKFAGKPGAPGATGPAGPAGPAGAAGKDGANGTNGTNGKDGISPVGTTFSGEANGCTNGGVKYVGASTNSVCNGKDGQTGFVDVLPPGESLYGTWSYGQNPEVDQVLNILTSISFNIPLENTPEVKFLAIGEENVAGCPGNVGSPAADPGFLCVYQQAGTAIPMGPASATPYGVTLGGTAGEKIKAQGWGVWVVTAPNPAP